MQRLIAAIIIIFGCHAIQASEFEPNVEMNQRVIKALIEAGSVPTKPHPIEHHFLCYTSDCLQELLEKGESLGYRAAYMGEDTYQGTHYWYGDLVKETVLALHIINQQNSLMLKLADEFNADYDGWGTPIIK